MGSDASQLFNFLTGYSRQGPFRKLVQAPTSLRTRIVELIEQQVEAPGSGRIVMKLNSLSDPTVIDALYAASGAGVSIDLIVRGICCLRPGVAGLSENIRVRSVVGRYLEHSRIYAFGDGSEAPIRYLIGSADMMPRNLDNRIEVLVPVEDPSLQRRLQEVLDVNLEDEVLAWRLGPDGTWERPTGDGPGVHRRLQQLAIERARSREPEAMSVGLV